MAVMPADYITLIVLFAGEIVYCDARGSMRAQAGDVILLDTSRMFTLHSPSQHSTSMTVARSTVDLLINQHSALGLLDRCPETTLVHDIFRTSVRYLERSNQVFALEVANILFRMLQLALAAGSRTSSVTVDEPRKRALAYLAARPPGGIDIETMSSELGISRSGLYRMFAADGGVFAFDRRRRLHLLHRDIVQASANESLGNIGLRHGFADAPALSKQFKKQFGYSMTSLRKLTPVMEHTLEKASTIQRYRDLIQRIS